MSVWSAKYKWVERAKAYDDYIERKKREEHEKAIMEMVERHARLAVAFQQRIAERLKAIDPNELSPTDLARWLDISSKLERISRGEPTEIGKQEVSLPPVIEVVLDDGDED
jgi:head-tail adaptor